jgi:hypothetical protein
MGISVLLARFLFKKTQQPVFMRLTEHFRAVSRMVAACWVSWIFGKVQTLAFACLNLIALLQPL